MPAVVVVHEQVHQRAGEQKQVGQRAQRVLVVLPKDVEGNDEAEADHSDAGPGGGVRAAVPPLRRGLPQDGGLTPRKRKGGGTSSAARRPGFGA